MARRTLFIINPAAGGGQALRRWSHFEQRLVAAGAPPEKALTQFPGQAEQIACRAARDFDTLAVAGGDGTVSEVVNGILSRADNRAGLTIVPCGTGNDTARNCGIRNLDDSFRALTNGVVRRMDVIEIGCVAAGQLIQRYGLSFGAAGIIGPVLRHATHRAKRCLGQKLAYRFALLRALWTYRPLQMRLNYDGNALQGRFLFLGLSNGEALGGGMRIAPGAKTDDGLLNVNLVGDVTPWEGLFELRRLSQGRHTNHPKVRYFSSRTISVDADQPVAVAADGDIIGTTPARFDVRPIALEFLVPRE